MSLDGAFGRLKRTVRLVGTFGPRELRIRYRTSSLDIAWALIGPIVTAVVYGFVLTRSFSVTTTCAPYLTVAWTGVVVWTFFATALSSSANSITGASHLVTKVYFPKEVLPLAMTAAATAELAIGMVTLAGLMAIQRLPIGWNALWVILPTYTIVVWSAAIGAALALAAVFFRDVIHATSLALRVGFFATPVMFESDQLPEAISWTRFYSPPAVAIEAIRTALLCNQRLDLSVNLIHAVLATAALLGVIGLTARRERFIADVI